MQAKPDRTIESIPPEVARHLGYYVYLYVDPRSDRPFYVGKGQGDRVLSHLLITGDSRKAQLIAELRAAGIDPRLEILAHALPNEETALRIEAAVMDLFGLDGLTNQVRGWRSIQLGRMPLSELVYYYAAKPVAITDPMLLIRINRLYRHGMSTLELYEATRGVWKLGRRRESARYAAAVFEAVVREVYVIDSWHRAGTSRYETRPTSDVERPDRVEFVGRVAHPRSGTAMSQVRGGVLPARTPAPYRIRPMRVSLSGSVGGMGRRSSGRIRERFGSSTGVVLPAARSGLIACALPLFSYPARRARATARHHTVGVGPPRSRRIFGGPPVASWLSPAPPRLGPARR